MGLGRILEHREPVLLRERVDPHHVRDLPVEVDGYERTGSRANRRGEKRRIQAVVELGGVDGHRPQTRLRNRLEGREKRVRRDDHLVTRFELLGHQGNAQRVQAAGEPDAVLHSAIRGKRALECRHGGPVDECVGVDHRTEVGKDLLPQVLVNRREVEKRNGGS